MGARTRSPKHFIGGGDLKYNILNTCTYLLQIPLGQSAVIIISTFKLPGS